MRRRALWLVVPIALVVLAGTWWWLTPAPEPTPRVDWRLRAGVLAGSGEVGLADGTPDRATFVDPFAVAARADGTVLVGDGDRLRAIGPHGHVSTVAGGDAGRGDGPGGAARFSTISGLAVGLDGVVFVADTGNHMIRRVDPFGTVTVVAGTGVAGFRDGPAHQATFDGPMGLVLDETGRLYVADTYNDAIRIVHPDGRVTTLAGGNGPGVTDGRGHDVRFDTPTGLARHPSGDLIVADTGNGRLRRIDAAGSVSTVALGGAWLSTPVGVAVADTGAIFASDERGAIIRHGPEGDTRLVAGGRGPGYASGLGAEARFRRPGGLAWVGPDRLVLADTGNALIRLVTDPQIAAIDPPPSPRVNPGFDAARFRVLPLIWPVPPFEGPHEVAGTHGERRGSDGAERFHTGVDVRVPQGTPVHAVRPGRVSSPLGNGGVGSINEWLRIGDVAYVHIRAGRDQRHRLLDADRFAASYGPDGELVRLRVRRGARFRPGDLVGTVNAFNHVHLAVGWPGDDHNPLAMRLVQFRDTIPPTIAPGGIRLFTAAGKPLDVQRDGRLLVHGRVQIVVDAWDQADDNVPWRRLGLHTLGYQVLYPDGTPAPGFEEPRITQRFDRLAPDSDAPRQVYAPGSGIPAYGSRRTRFLYVVTTTLDEGTAAWGAWDTTQLAAGDYVLRAHVADIAGNVAAARRDVAVTVLGS